MHRGRHRAKQLDNATCIPSTKNNGIHRIEFSQKTTFIKLNYYSSEETGKLIII